MNKSIIIAMSLVLGACTVGPDYQAPQNNIFDKWFSSSASVATQEPINIQWWREFNDPLLSQYIAQAAENNKDIQIAIANVKRARAVRRESSSDHLPSVGVGAGASRSKSASSSSGNNRGQTRNLFDAGFDASWELDLFGSTRRGNEAADARIGSAIASYRDVILATFSDVARNYYEARGAQKRAMITQENADLLKQTYDLIDARVQAGEASEFDISRARGEYQTTLAKLPNIQADMESSIFALSVLVGQPPEALLGEMQKTKPLPTPPDFVPVGLRSDILRRRPDVQMAERELAASSADIGVETAELFPKFSLTGDIGSQARTFGDLFTGGSGVWSLATALSWSVFNGGAIHARIDIANAENEAALASYEKAVLEALGDAETALTRYGREIETRKRLEASTQSRRDSVKLARQLLDAGEYDFLAVLDTERELVSSEENLVTSETNSIVKLIALYTALGGGWE